MQKSVVEFLLKKVAKDYDKIADEFDQTRQNAWFEFSIYAELMRSKDVILDVGCGNGRLFDELSKGPLGRYRGVDVSKNLIKKAQVRYKKDMKASFAVGDFLNLPYKKKIFDKIFCIASFHHLPSKEARLQALLNLKSVLKNDGVIVLSVWNLWQKKYLKYILKSVLNLYKYDFGDCFIPWGKTDVLRYYHAFTLYEIRNLAKKADLYVCEELMVDNKKICNKISEANNFIFFLKKN